MRVCSQVLADSFTPLRDRRAEWQARLAMIAAAERFLYASTYYVGPDHYGAEYLETLGAAAERGVETTLIVDRFGQWLGASGWSATQRHQVVDGLASAAARGVRVVWTRPDSVVRTLVGGGHHVKIQVGDAGPALFASSNLSRHSFEVWGEFSALVGGGVVRALLEALHAVIPAPNAAHLPLLDNSGDDGDIEMTWWWCNPSADPTRLAPFRQGAGNPITDGLVGAVNRAEHSIAVTSFYFKPTWALRDALLAAARRDVAIEVYHSGPGALGGAEASWLAAVPDYATWLDSGVQLFEAAQGEHSKLVLIDGRWAAFGSYNLDHSAHDVVAEAMLATEAPDVVAAVSAVMEALRQDPRARRVSPGYRDDWSLKRRLRAGLVRPLRRWL